VPPYDGNPNPPLGVWEMLGSFLREASVLIFVFAPLDQAIRGGFTFWFQAVGLLTAGTFLFLGIILEKRRYP
jgi:hypothetical protein